MADLEKFLKVFKTYNQFDLDQGLTFNVLKPGEIFYKMTIQSKHLSSPGVAHGAVIAGLMDCVLGMTALSFAITMDQLTSTVEFKLNFIKPALLDDELEGHGVIEYKGKSLIITSGNIINKKTGELVAKGLGTFNTYPLAKKEELYEKIK